ncbi:WD40 repeat-like protein [Pleurotus eryngii]|uniref:WD40 repeat-like protein n=1 Tax=Pleurotus eryngii TaxID=5323 RepID=A0A9P5ZMN5_PLEER|nr:WD40 repeat-like protein [Pleurotus eryngii]
MVLQYQVKCCIDLGSESPRIHNISFAPNGRYIAAATGDQIRVWSVDSGVEEYAMPWHNAEALSVVWTHDTQFLGGFSNGMILGATMPSLLDEVQQPSHPALGGFDPLNMPLLFMALHPSHSLIAVGTTDMVQIWRPRGITFTVLARLMLTTIPNPPKSGKSVCTVTSVAWMDGETVIVSYLHHGILTWKIDTPSQLPHSGLQVQTPVYTGAVSSDGQRFVVFNGNNKSFDIYATQTGVRLTSLCSTSNMQHHPVIFIHHDNIILGTRDAALVLWDSETELEIATLDTQGNQPTRLAQQENYNHHEDIFSIASSTSSGRILVWESCRIPVHGIMPKASCPPRRRQVIRASGTIYG